MTNTISAFIFILTTFIYSIALARPDNIIFNHITVDDGLSSNNVYCIFQDSQGFMWFGTDAGLNKYDGYAFHILNHDPKNALSLSDNVITAIQEDQNKNLWIGTFNGLNRYDLITGNMEILKSNPQDSNSIISNVITSLYINKQNEIWIGTDKGLCKLLKNSDKDGKGHKYLIKTYSHDAHNPNSISNDYITTLYQDRDGVLWVGTQNGLNRFDAEQESFIHFFHDPDDSLSLSANMIATIYEDKTKALWISTWRPNGILNRYDRASNTFEHMGDKNRIFRVSFVTSIAEDVEGNLWFGALTNRGLYQYIRPKRFARYAYSPKNRLSLNSNFIQCLYADTCGRLWIGTNKGGVNYLDKFKTKFTKFEQIPGKDHFHKWHDLHRIIEDRKGTLWIATWGGGVAHLDPASGKFERLSPKSYNKVRKGPNSISWPWCWDVCEDRSNNIWIATASGLNKYDPKLKTFKKYFHNPQNSRHPGFLSSVYIYCVLQDRYNALWIGTNNGLNKMDVDEERFEHYFHDPADSFSISSNRIHYIYEDKEGDLWFGSIGGGLNFYDREKNRFVRYLHDPSDKSSLSDNRVFVITQDHLGYIWVGTRGGINKFDKRSKKITYYTMEDGLCSNMVVGIIEDNAGYLWISTTNGLSKFNPGTISFRNYTTDDGLQSNQFNRYSFYKGKKGRLYFGGPKGFNTFIPDSIQDNPYPPPIIISSMRVLDKQFVLNRSQVAQKEILLAHNQNIFSFEFTALNFTNPWNNSYAYRLEGVDEDWVFCDGRRYARYTNVPPGTYTFKVKGSNNDGIWNEKGTSIKIIITPPPWRTWWAYALYVILTAAAVFGGFRFESKRREMKHRAVVAELQAKTLQAQKKAEQEKMRSRIAGDLHDEIGGNLSSIALLGETLERRLKPTGKEKQRLKQIRRIAMSTAESMRDIVWFVNPMNDDLDKLLAKMRQTANTMLSQLKLRFDIKRPDDAWQGDLNFRRNVFLFFKEALQNILRHAQAKQVQISIQQNADVFRLEIQDDGVGFDASKENSGNGLKNFERRAAEMEASFKLKSKPGEGTSLLLTKKIP